LGDCGASSLLAIIPAKPYPRDFFPGMVSKPEYSSMNYFEDKID